MSRMCDEFSDEEMEFLRRWKTLFCPILRSQMLEVKDAVTSNLDLYNPVELLS